MTTLTTASTISTIAAGLVGLALTISGASAQQQPQLPQGWFKACSQQEETNICNVQNIMVSESGQLLTGVSLIQIEGSQARRVFQVTVPVGRLIPPGIGMQIDGGETQKLDYVICLPDRCIAEGQLTDNLVASFKRGSNLRLTSVNFQNQPNPIQVSLSGFTQAFDGAPLQQSDIEDRQRQLQDFVSRNTEDFNRRLREEQERAKQGGAAAPAAAETETD
ncbi:MAG: invasion associated locus B family protein [Aliihoeflea sp.]